MIEYTYGRGQATVYKWEDFTSYVKKNPGYKHRSIGKIDALTSGFWVIQNNIPNYPQTLARVSSKNTLFDPNFNYMLSIDNIQSVFFIWNIELNRKEINIPTGLLGYGKCERPEPSAGEIREMA